jgi:hypothetical protein
MKARLRVVAAARAKAVNFMTKLAVRWGKLLITNSPARGSKRMPPLA